MRLKSRLPEYQLLQASGPPWPPALRSDDSGQVRLPAAKGEAERAGGDQTAMIS